MQEDSYEKKLSQIPFGTLRKIIKKDSNKINPKKNLVLNLIY